LRTLVLHRPQVQLVTTRSTWVTGPPHFAPAVVQFEQDAPRRESQGSFRSLHRSHLPRQFCWCRFMPFLSARPDIETSHRGQVPSIGEASCLQSGVVAVSANVIAVFWPGYSRVSKWSVDHAGSFLLVFLPADIALIF